MKATTKGFILLVFLGVMLIVSWKFLAPYMEERRFERTSDSSKISDQVTIAGDSWLGYFVLRSPEFKTRMRSIGINPVWIDDNANYRERMEKFARGEYDFIVATVDSWLLNAAPINPQFPGVIIAIIDESKGGDAIVARTTIADLNGLNAPEIKIALTPASPSDFLLKAVASHFNVRRLLSGGAWKMETDGAKKAYDALMGNKVDAAVLWEPYVSKALSDAGFHKLLGTDKTKGLIVDILIAHRTVMDSSPEKAETLLEAYFGALRTYQKSREDMEEQAAKDAKEKKVVARQMLEGIDFIDFDRNCQEWFGLGGGVSRELLAGSIDSTIDILIDNGDLKSDPLLSNPYTIINSSVLESLSAKGTLSLGSKFTEPGISADAGQVTFSQLDDLGWKNLKTVGTLRIRPIVFQTSNQILSVTGKEEVDRAAEVIAHYPQFRILVKGHTSPGGDEQANNTLSQERADAVRQYLISVHDVKPERVKALGIGSQEPLTQNASESFRAYKLRLQRVEFIFLETAG